MSSSKAQSRTGLAPDQKTKIQTSQETESVELSGEELEERIAPRSTKRLN